MNRLHDIIHMNPAHPLPPRSHPPTQAQSEGRQHFRESPTLGAKHQPKPNIDRRNAGLRGNPAGLLRLPANFG